MPRASKSRSSLPGHSKAPRIGEKRAASGDDSLDAELSAFLDDAPQPSTSVKEVDEEPKEPAKKRTKVEKQLAKRAALLEKINAAQRPYSKSHARRMRRKANPDNNLNAALDDVELALDQVVEPDTIVDEQEGAKAEQDSERQAKGKERLTRKKRERVLAKETKRLPAVMSNPSFASNPFASIRLHTINTINAQKKQKQ